MASANYRITAKLDISDRVTEPDKDGMVGIVVNTNSKKASLEAKEQLVKAGWTVKVEMTKEIE